jgi:hypothetical protein
MCLGTILRSPRFDAARARCASAREEPPPSSSSRRDPRALEHDADPRPRGPRWRGWASPSSTRRRSRLGRRRIDWINTATVFERAAFANLLVTERGGKQDNWFEPEAWVPKGSDAKAAVAIFLDALVDGRVRDAARTEPSRSSWRAREGGRGGPLPGGRGGRSNRKAARRRAAHPLLAGVPARMITRRELLVSSAALPRAFGAAAPQWMRRAMQAAPPAPSRRSQSSSAVLLAEQTTG